MKLSETPGMNTKTRFLPINKHLKCMHIPNNLCDAILSMVQGSNPVKRYVCVMLCRIIPQNKLLPYNDPNVVSGVISLHDNKCFVFCQQLPQINFTQIV